MIANIPYTAPAAPAQAGLLNTPDLLGWLFTAFLIAAGLFIMLPAARDSVKALWAPVGRWLSRLRCPWAWEGMFVWSAFSGAFLRPLKTFWDNFPEDEDGQYREQLRRLAYMGFIPPILT
jgi:hypothetical protein